MTRFNPGDNRSPFVGLAFAVVAERIPSSSSDLHDDLAHLHGIPIVSSTGCVSVVRSANAYALYEGMWRTHAAGLVGDCQLERFDVEDVQALYRHLRESGVSAAVMHRVGVVLHRAFAVAARQRVYMRANPFALVEKPKHEAKETRVLTVAEARHLLRRRAADGLRRYGCCS